MTALQAIKQAQETGQIAITKQTANLLEAVENFLDAAEDLNTAFETNIPAEMSDNETLDKFYMDFYNLFTPVQDFVFNTIGGVILKTACVYGLKNKFEGL